MTGRRRFFALLVGATICLTAAPALASLLISGPMRANATLVTGPQFFAYGSGTSVTLGTETGWDGFALDGLVVDDQTGTLALDRLGPNPPSDLAWWDTSFPTRVCGTPAVAAEPPVEVPAVEPPVEEPSPTDPEPADPESADPAPTDPAPTDPAPGRSDDRDNEDSDKPGLGGDRQDDKNDAAPVDEPPADDVPVDEATADEPPVDTPPDEEPPVDPELPSPAPAADAGRRQTAFTFDSATEIAAGRLRSDLADLRIIDAASGTLLAHRVLGPVPSAETEVLVGLVAATDRICAYWGDSAAVSVEDLSLAAPVVADGRWTWERWDGAPHGTSLELVDWEAAPALTGRTTAAQTEQNVCDRCATELSGQIVPPVTGDYTFYLSSDQVGRVEIGRTDAVASLAPVVSLSEPTLPDVFDTPDQTSAPVALVGGERYAFRARSKDLQGDDHLQVAWSVEGAEPELIGGEHLVDTEGVAGGLTRLQFDVVTTADFSPPPTQTVSVSESQIPDHACGACLHRLGGYVLAPADGIYRFWLSSEAEGSLVASAVGGESEAPVIAWTPFGTEPATWVTYPTQASDPVALAAGEVIWIQATSRDGDGTGHLQVGWSLITPGVDETVPPVETPVTLIGAENLSTTLPESGTIVTTPFTGVEGLHRDLGTFVSGVLDTSETGSNVYGLLGVLANAGETSTVEVRLAAAASPEGPWEAVGPFGGDGSFTGGEPIPLPFDGLRYLRFQGVLSTSDPVTTPSIEALSVAHDLVEVGSSDATTSIDLQGLGEHYVLRVRGAAGAGASSTMEILPNGSVVGLSASTWLGPILTPQIVVSDGTVSQGVGGPLPFGRVSPQHIGVTVTGATTPATLRMRWIATDSGGAMISHDIELTITP